MTAEKQKRRHFALVFNYRLSRGTARKLIRAERRENNRYIKKGYITKKTRFVCNHCGAALKLYEWLIEYGGVIRCPKCRKEIMDICFTERVEGTR